MDWELYAWVKRGKARKAVLVLLNDSNMPLAAKDIGSKLHYSIPQVSYVLRELSEKNIVECLNPKDKIGRLYKISKDGNNIIGAISND